MKLMIVGAGGIACAALPVLYRQLCHTRDGDAPHEVTIFDGDRFEDRNTLRQFASVGRSGKNKAEAWIELLEAQRPDDANVVLKAEPVYITAAEGTLPSGYKPDLIWCMVDNHHARRAAVFHGRQMKVPVISSANESVVGEAWTWFPALESTNADPFVRHPEMVTSDEGSPVTVEHCTDTVVLETSPQTPSANMMAAAAGMLLFNAVSTSAGMEIAFMPCHVRLGSVEVELKRVGDFLYSEEDPNWAARLFKNSMIRRAKTK